MDTSRRISTIYNKNAEAKRKIKEETANTTVGAENIEQPHSLLFLLDRCRCFTTPGRSVHLSLRHFPTDFPPRRRPIADRSFSFPTYFRSEQSARSLSGAFSTSKEEEEESVKVDHRAFTIDDRSCWLLLLFYRLNHLIRSKLKSG